MNRYRLDIFAQLKDKSSQSNLISRREIEPLLYKAYEILKSYECAVGCAVSVLDKTGSSIEISNYKDRMFFCALCRKYYADPSRVWGEDEYPCTGMHQDSMVQAKQQGGPYMYVCDLGFIYWTSIIYSGGRQVGALRAGRLLFVERAEAVARIRALSRGRILEREAVSYLMDIPERTYDEIKAMAQMLQFCTEYLTSGVEDTDEAIKYIFEYKTKTLHQLSYMNALNEPPTPDTENPGYPLDKERMLLAALRRGDNKTGRAILRELLELITITSPGNFEFIQLRAIELVVLLSREILTVDRSEDGKALETNNRYLKKIQESRTIEALTETMQSIIDRMARQIFSFQGIRHASALRKAERFIWENYTRKLCLQEVAAASGLSAPYFSTIFKEEMGENLSSYLNRLRVEKAAVLLRETDVSLHEIAWTCGFEDQSWFSKLFKSYTGISPRKYREQGGGCAISAVPQEEDPDGYSASLGADNAVTGMDSI
ncbi:MAG: helix-turn-helix domain-containing protein [Treponema sp.]|jgi:AraC-like DNA-binding protein/ligand-binding sensor protein|nr:helix-turn-helix domain-containing protein [Treponema sp.]